MAAPANEPKKERIALDIVTSLEAISKGGGYHTDAGDNVTRHALEIELNNAFPLLEVITGEELRVDSGIGCFRSDANFVITGYVNDASTDQALIRLEADVKKALLTDRSRSTLARLTAFVESDTDYHELTADSLGIVALRFTITYDWTLSDL